MIAERLREWLGESFFWRSFKASPDYGSYLSPAYTVGYSLAEQARSILKLESGPIRSMRDLVEERLGLTVIQGHLGDAFAGATIANGQARGIVLNIDGANQKPWVRRATLAHELGHLLFDPNERLNQVRVDTYNDDPASEKDFVEQRANAFAVAFLAPPEAVRARFDVPSPNLKEDDVTSIVEEFGISPTATRYHLQNIFYRTTDAPLVRRDIDDSQWRAEEDFTLDFFKPDSTSPQRRGRLSKTVVQAFDEGLITDDTAALYLDMTTIDFHESVETLRSIWNS